MLLNGGDITYEESLQHSQRNILTKSLGNKGNLSSGYVQNLSYSHHNLEQKLEDQDILILCSDGVWSLLSSEQLAEIFINNNDLNLGVEKVIEQVLEKGANDNATIIALKCSIKYNN
jgi:protein phosphatase